MNMELPDLSRLTTFDASLREIPTDVEALQAAIQQADAQLQMVDASEGPETTLRLLGYLGNGCRILGRTAEAVDYLERAVSVCRTAGDRKGELVNTIRLAEARKYHGDIQGAEELLRTVRTWTADHSLTEYRDFVLQHLGKCLLDQGGGHTEEAILCFEEALALRMAKGNQSLIESTELALARARGMTE